jgi:hypothetical protein
MLTRRLLPPEEWEKIAAREPFVSGGLPDPTYWRIVVVEDDGQIVGSCALLDTVHWDAWNVDPAYRGNPVVFKELIEGGVSVMIEYGIELVHTTVPDGRPDLEAMLERFGFRRAPGTLFYFDRRS